MVASTSPRCTIWPSAIFSSTMRPVTGALMRAMRVSSASTRPASCIVPVTSAIGAGPTWICFINSWSHSISSGLRAAVAALASAGIFTSAQAEAGRVAYERTCGQCHTMTLMGRKGDPGELPPVNSLSASYQKFIGPRGFVAPLAGKVFLNRWGGKR